MNRIIILIFLLSSLIYSKQLILTKEDIGKINSSPNKSYIINRFKQFKNMRDKITQYSVKRKLSHVNAFFNKILPINDKTKYNSDDYWATRKEFIIEGRGDCEDYVIAKYFTLLELGIEKKNLYFAVVQVKGKTTYHMNLLYMKNQNATPLVLDNLSFKVVPLPIRTKLLPMYAFNEYNAHLLDKNGFGKKIKIDWGKINKWELLLDRIYNKNE